MLIHEIVSKEPKARELYEKLERLVDRKNQEIIHAGELKYRAACEKASEGSEARIELDKRRQRAEISLKRVQIVCSIPEALCLYLSSEEIWLTVFVFWYHLGPTGRPGEAIRKTIGRIRADDRITGKSVKPYNSSRNGQAGWSSPEFLFPISPWKLIISYIMLLCSMPRICNLERRCSKKLLRWPWPNIAKKRTLSPRRE